MEWLGRLEGLKGYNVLVVVVLLLRLIVAVVFEPDSLLMHYVNLAVASVAAAIALILLFVKIFRKKEFDWLLLLYLAAFAVFIVLDIKGIHRVNEFVEKWGNLGA
jgi:cell division protein FtsW (lipid II flippase)